MNACVLATWLDNGVILSFARACMFCSKGGACIGVMPGSDHVWGSCKVVTLQYVCLYDVRTTTPKATLAT